MSAASAAARQQPAGRAVATMSDPAAEAAIGAACRVLHLPVPVSPVRPHRLTADLHPPAEVTGLDPGGLIPAHLDRAQKALADVDPGQQLITVIRSRRISRCKGSRALQQLPASPDAFVWLRLYQLQMQDLVPAGRDQPLWWTLRRRSGR